MLVEVMGRNCGWIALTAGLAGGAEIILIPEQPFSQEDICKQLLESRAKGKQYSIVVVAEGAGSGIDLGQYIRSRTGLETRVSVLGHIQRGGAPTVSDRLLASRLAETAVTALLDGKTDVMIGYRNNQCVEIAIADAVGNKKEIDRELYRLAEVLSQ